MTGENLSKEVQKIVKKASKYFWHKMLRNSIIAPEDLEQDFYLKFCREKVTGLDFTNKHRLQGYIYTIIGNISKNYIQKYKNEFLSIPLDEEMSPHKMKYSSEYLESVKEDIRDKRGILLKNAKNIPRGEEMILMRLYGYTYSQIGAAFNRSYTWAYAKIKQIRDNVKNNQY